MVTTLGYTGSTVFIGKLSVQDQKKRIRRGTVVIIINNVLNEKSAHLKAADIVTFYCAFFIIHTQTLENVHKDVLFEVSNRENGLPMLKNS